MPDEARLIAAFLLAMAAAFAVTPATIAFAVRLGFCDNPGGGVEYKIHRAPTPYLGGAVVIGAFLLAGSVVAQELTDVWPILAAALCLFILGTLDDRYTLAAAPRLLIEFGIASALWAAGFGWDLFDGTVLDFFATNLWVVGVANCFNLMDNMDGVTPTLAGVTSLATAVLAAIEGDQELAILCFGLSGACFGFLPYNAAGPARIFLGDGGSLPIGFVIAVAIMSLPGGDGLGWTHLLLGPVLAGLPVADTALRMIWRWRAGVPLLHGGQDSVTHILMRRLGSAREVATRLGLLQVGLATIAIGAAELGRGSVAFAGSLWFSVIAVAVVLLERQAWQRPGSDDAVEGRPEDRELSAASPVRRPRVSLVEASAIIFIAVSFGLSPALYGFYNLSVWGPIALVLLATLLGLVIARPAAPRRAAVVAAGALSFLWLFSLLSSRWAESADQAVLDANRWVVYAALFAILILLLRDDRLGKLLVACATAAIVAFAGYLAIRLLGPNGDQLFVLNLLQEPLGYGNAQAGYLMLGLWPLVALAERARSHVLSAVGIALAVVLGGLALLGQTRGIIPAVVISAVVVVVALPGRLARLWTLVGVAAGIALAAPLLLDVYEGAEAGAPEPEKLQVAVVTLLAVAVLTGVAWGLARASITRLARKASRRRLSAVSAGALTAIALGGVAAGWVALGDPFERGREELRALKTLDTTPADSSARFTAQSRYRYDYWRVAVNQFREHPVKGIGAGNYERTYFQERRTVSDIRQPHSLPLQTLSELGVMGALGLLLFIAAVLTGFAARARAARNSTTDLALAVAGGGMFLVWLVHTSVDWLHLIPGVTGIALCGAAVLVAPWARPRGAAGGGPLRLATIAGCVLLVVLAATLVGRNALSDKYRSEAQEVVDSDPRAALERTSQSLQLNDESLPAYYVRAAAFARLNDYARARATLLEAARREPHDFVPWGLLGDLAVRRGDEEQAARAYGRASMLNPREARLRRLARDPAEATR